MWKEILKQFSLFLLSVFLVVFLVVLLFFYPDIIGKYRLNKFTQSISLGMDRNQVHEIADDIKYWRHDTHEENKKWIKDSEKENIYGIYDVYYFQSRFLSYLVIIKYDNKGKVRDIRID